MHDKAREACGISGIYAPGGDVARMAFFVHYALQHRGQESAGIATSDGRIAHIHKGMGLVSQVFNEENLHHLKQTRQAPWAAAQALPVRSSRCGRDS